MKCAVCENPMYRHSWIVTQIQPTGVSATANICHTCMWESVGARGVRSLNAALMMASWTQEKLPEPS